MSSPPSTAVTSPRPGRVSTATILFFTVSAATPLTVCAAVVSTGLAIAGQIGLASAFAAIAVVLALFSFGYTEMAARIPNAGAFYAYLARGLGKPIGVGGAWVALVAYIALEIGLFGAIGPALSSLIKEQSGLGLPWWVFALLVWAPVSWLALRKIRHIAWVLRVLLLAEVVLLVAYSVANLAHPAGGFAVGRSLAWEALNPMSLLGSGGGSALTLSVLGFVGFEQSAIFSERVGDPRVVRRATFLSLLGLGVLYTLSAVSTVVAAGPEVVALAAEQQQGLLFFLAERNLGPWAAFAGEVLLITSVFAALFAFRHAGASYAFSLGREGVLHRTLGTLHAPTQQPRSACNTLSVIALAVIIVYAALDLDPIVDLFFTLGTGGALGVLTLLTGTSIAVYRYFGRQENRPTGFANTVRCQILPFIVSGILLYILGMVVWRFDLLLGVDDADPRRWGIPAGILVLFLLGVVHGLRLRTSRPEVYARIGLGAEAALTDSAAHR